MPCLRSAVIDKDGIFMLSSSGTTVTLTRADVMAHYRDEHGSAATRRAATIAWIKDQIVALLGDDILGLSNFTSVDFTDDLNATVTVDVER